MGRKKSQPKKETQNVWDCQICGTGCRKNDPTRSIVYMKAANETAICADCGATLIHVLDIARQRWG